MMCHHRHDHESAATQFQRLDGPKEGCCKWCPGISNAAWIFIGLVTAGGIAAAIYFGLQALQTNAVTGSIILSGTFSQYPTYTGEFRVSGTVDMEFKATQVMLTYDLFGVDPTCAEGPMAGTDNSCGIHFHTGISSAMPNCELPVAVGSHLWNATLNATDPWVTDAYYTTAKGSLTVEYGMSYNDTLGYAFVIHDRMGNRLTCELIYPQTVLHVNTGGMYPGYNGGLTVGGNVELNFQNTQVVIHYHSIMGDSNCINGPSDLANSCGIHFHIGSSCDNADNVGGHYYHTSITPDPWLVATYMGDSGRVPAVIYGYNYTTTQGRTLVVHDRDGTRISCDLIKPATAMFDLTEFRPYVGYEGPLMNVMGTIAMAFQMTSVQMDYNLTGVDPLCVNGPSGLANSCGIHIHQGFHCSDPDTVGGHFWLTPDANGNEVADPWQYDAYYEGATTNGYTSGPIRVEYGYPWASDASLGLQGTAGRVVIVHDYAGNRIACAQTPVE